MRLAMSVLFLYEEIAERYVYVDGKGGKEIGFWYGSCS